MIPSRPTFIPYQRKPCHPLDSMYETVNPTMVGMPAPPANEYHTPSDLNMEHHGTSNEIEDIIQNTANARWVEAHCRYSAPPINMSTSEPMSPYQSELRRQMEILFGAANRTVPVPSISVTHPNAGTETAQSAEAHPHIATTQIAHSCLATVPCQWTGEDNSETCDDQIACKSVPAHFGDTHGIRKLGRNTMIDCLWEGCLRRVKRKNFVRHVRERHLGHPREKKHPS